MTDILEAPLTAPKPIEPLVEVESALQPEIEDKDEVLAVAEAAEEETSEVVLEAIEPAAEQLDEVTEVALEEAVVSEEVVVEEGEIPSVEIEEIQDSIPPVEEDVESAPAVEENVVAAELEPAAVVDDAAPVEGKGGYLIDQQSLMRVIRRL